MKIPHMKSIEDILNERKTGAREALNIFDHLDAVPVDEAGKTIPPDKKVCCKIEND